MKKSSLENDLGESGLTIVAASAPETKDGLPEEVRQILLLGLSEGAWDRVSASAEFGDGAPDPLDRWSARVIGGIAERHGLPAYFPFGGPPYWPFVDWPLRSEQVFSSPVGLMVHAEHGLWISYRGALGLTEPIAVPEGRSPCPECSAPCRTACPVGALGEAGYDVAACRAYIATPEGAECLRNGCQVRRSCPVGQRFMGAERAAFHMEAFKKP